MANRIYVNVFFATVVAVSTLVADDWNKSYSIAGRAELKVDTGDGSVTVRAWDQKRIEAKVTTVGWRIAPDEVTIRESQLGDRVDIEVRLPRGDFGFGNRSVKVELQVPRDTRTNVHTGDGGVRVSGVNGDVRVSTGDGGIDVDGISGSFEGNTGDGHIRARGRFDGLMLRTGDGGIEVDADHGSKIASSWRISTGDGGITLRLPQDFSADLDVHTGDGDINVDLPVTLSGTIRKDHDLRGKLNGGGFPLVIRTGDGGVRVAKL